MLDHDRIKMTNEPQSTTLFVNVNSPLKNREYSSPLFSLGVLFLVNDN